MSLRIIKKKKQNVVSENKKIQQELDKIATRKEIILSSPDRLKNAALTANASADQPVKQHKVKQKIIKKSVVFTLQN